MGQDIIGIERKDMRTRAWKKKGERKCDQHLQKSYKIKIEN